MVVAAAVPLALPLAEKAGKAILEVAQTPVIGWTRIVTYEKGRKHPKHVEERMSANVRAWELAALGLVGLAWWQLEELKKAAGTSPFPGSDPFSAVLRGIFTPWAP